MIKWWTVGRRVSGGVCAWYGCQHSLPSKKVPHDVDDDATIMLDDNMGSTVAGPCVVH